MGLMPGMSHIGPWETLGEQYRNTINEKSELVIYTSVQNKVTLDGGNNNSLKSVMDASERKDK